MKLLQFLFAPGMRKVTVLGVGIWLAELAGIVALFANSLPAQLFVDYTVQILQYGGIIFAGGNVLEHALALGKKEKPAP